MQGLGEHRGDEAIVQQIIGLAHNLGVTAVAEGVDTELQAETLKGLTCDLAQGYYYSHAAAGRRDRAHARQGQGRARRRPAAQGRLVRRRRAGRPDVLSS